jgi:hypothetical protein
MKQASSAKGTPMTFPVSARFGLIVGIAIAAAAPAMPAAAAQFTLDIPALACPAGASATLAVNGATVQIACSGGTTNPPPTTPGVPSGCVPTADLTQLPSTGGIVRLAATCSSGPVTSWTWTRTDSSTPATGTDVNLIDYLRPNTGTTAIKYTYTIVATNTVGQSTPATIDVTVLAPGQVVTNPPPTTGAISCAGYGKTLVLDLPWANSTVNTRPTTVGLGGFMPGDALVVKITVPAGATQTQPGNISMAEWGGGPVQRFAKLSKSYCDFTPGAWSEDTFAGITISTPIYVGVQAPSLSGASLQAGQTYYLNVRNTNAQGVQQTCENGVCNMYVDLLKPGGT